MADKNSMSITAFCFCYSLSQLPQKKNPKPNTNQSPRNIDLLSFQQGEQQVTGASVNAPKMSTSLSANRLFKALQFQTFTVLCGGRLETFCYLDCEGNCNIGLGKDKGIHNRIRNSLFFPLSVGQDIWMDSNTTHSYVNKRL